MENNLKWRDDYLNNNQEQTGTADDLLTLFDPLASRSATELDSLLDLETTLTPNSQTGPFVSETYHRDSNSNSPNEETLRSDFQSMLVQRFNLNQTKNGHGKDMVPQHEARGAIPKRLRVIQGMGDTNNLMELDSDSEPPISTISTKTTKTKPIIDLLASPNVRAEIHNQRMFPSSSPTVFPKHKMAFQMSETLQSDDNCKMSSRDDNECKITKVAAPRNTDIESIVQNDYGTQPSNNLNDNLSARNSLAYDQVKSSNAQIMRNNNVNNKVETIDKESVNSSRSRYVSVLANISKKLKLDEEITKQVIEAKPVVNINNTSNINQHGTTDWDTQYSLLLGLFPNADPMYLHEKLTLYHGNQKQLENFIFEETQKTEASELQEQMLENEYLGVLRELPHLEPDILRQKWSKVAGDRNAIRQLINTEKHKLKFKTTLQNLQDMFPELSLTYLKTRLRQLCDDDVGLQLFIEEERANQASETQLMKMVDALPTIDPAELRIICDQFQGDPLLVEEYIQEKQVEIQIEAEKELQWMNIQAMFPDCDPNYLQQRYETTGGDETLVNELLLNLMDKKDYPKCKEIDPALRERKELWNRYMNNLDIKDYIQLNSDPLALYLGSKGDNNPASMTVILNFLQYRYPNSTVQELTQLFNSENKNLTETCRRKEIHFPDSAIVNSWTMPEEPLTEQFLKEIYFIQNRDLVCYYLKEEKNRRQDLLDVARLTHDLWECLCCFENEVLTEDIVTCPDGHTFCKECFRKYVETELGDAKTTFKCITDCTKEFTLSILERCLPHNVYIKIEKKKQAEEVSAAALDDLVSCPCCDFMQPLSPDDKVFKCLNPSCLKETCRLCKEPNHIPLRCNEVERPKDVQARVGIEETMTEALVRSCYQCKKKFVKVEGCDHISCTCGAQMCYICRQPWSSTHRCAAPANMNDVRAAGLQARDAVLRQNPDVRLVHDPTLK